MHNNENGIVHSNLLILDEAFYIPQLDRFRRIWVYLPSEYEQAENRYPVIYMHDGQNLFESAFSEGSGWALDESMAAMNGKCIIVGIDNGEHRITEYNFRDHLEHGEGEGRRYIAFIRETLKPVIDEKFRTLPEREHTYIAGSSLGGLVSLFGAVYASDVFGGAGIFSPALWLVPDFATDLQNMITDHPPLPQHFYFYGGGQEDENMLPFIEQAAVILSAYPQYKVFVDVQQDGKHSESYWKEHFPAFFVWLNSNAPAELLPENDNPPA